ncbi:Hypothetical predicted protein [Pelobates cultripes]|uniref:Uncharacterized protein n=1 Tax=Pelobates cultripes TaxID=61616 RepID=A0AAD1T9J6_PELCU|nr:Hypothetical predicted protein [Pelobates cultripes]
MASRKPTEVKSSSRKDKKEASQDKSMNIYFSPQQHKILKQKMNDINSSNDTLESEGIKISEKDLLLRSSLRSNLEEIKMELATTAAEIKSEIKQEINVLAAKMQRFEDQEMDFQVKTLTDESQKAHSKILALELKLNDMEVAEKIYVSEIYWRSAHKRTFCRLFCSFGNYV